MEMSKRDAFLIHMYDQMFNDINRHLLVIWQSIIIIFTTLGALLLEKKSIISIDFSTTLTIVVITWYLAHVYDSCSWYNRNLAIISNIERQFLDEGDRGLIQWYFASHRLKNKMISHLNIQYWFGVAIVSMIVLNHFYHKILPAYCMRRSPDLITVVPYFVLFGCVCLLYLFRKEENDKYEEFLMESPGKEMEPLKKKLKGHGQG